MDWIDTASGLFGQGVAFSVLAFFAGVKLLSRRQRSQDLQQYLVIQAVVYSLVGFVLVMIALGMSS